MDDLRTTEKCVTLVLLRRIAGVSSLLAFRQRGLQHRDTFAYTGEMEPVREATKEYRAGAQPTLPRRPCLVTAHLSACFHSPCTPQLLTPHRRERVFRQQVPQCSPQGRGPQSSEHPLDLLIPTPSKYVRSPPKKRWSQTSLKQKVKTPLEGSKGQRRMHQKASGFLWVCETEQVPSDNF